MDAEQLQTQLEACLEVARNKEYEVINEGDERWSPAYQAVLELRQALDQISERVRSGR
jgi:hypothetical protein